MTPLATVSIDVDPIDLHLEGYGFRSRGPDPAAYTLAVPRLLESLARHDVRATFFVVGRDAAVHAGTLAAIVAAGHEVASHSHTHPLALTRCPREAIRRELMESRAALERAGAGRVVGFRAPNFDMDASVLRLLAEAGYGYDASGYPTPALIAARCLLALKSRDPGAVLRLRAWPFSWRRSPWPYAAPARTLLEFPVSVTPTLRMPVYHTLRYVTDDLYFERVLDGFLRRRETVSYPMHAVDVMGLEEDRLDARMAAHPGMRWRLDRKLALLDRTLAAIARRFRTLPFRDRTGSEMPRDHAAN